MATKKILDMMEKFLRGEYEALAFSYDFPDQLIDLYDGIETEYPLLADLLNDELPEACSMFDPYNTGDEYTVNELEFRAIVQRVFDDAQKIIARKQRAM